jgi:hypothetical protein
MKYYSKEECLTALQRATRTINSLTESCTKYTRGTNCCFALLAEYDLELRGQSKARDEIDFEWSNTRQFVVKVARNGYTIPEYLEYCGYELLKNNKPQVGDVAFDDAAMIHGGVQWISTTETNNGVQSVRQAFFLERHIAVLARPIRS